MEIVSNTNDISITPASNPSSNEPIQDILECKTINKTREYLVSQGLTKYWISEENLLRDHSNSKTLLEKYTNQQRQQRLTQRLSLSPSIKSNFMKSMKAISPNSLVVPTAPVTSKIVNNKREQPRRTAKRRKSYSYSDDEDDSEIQDWFSDEEIEQVTEEKEINTEETITNGDKELVTDENSNDSIEGSESELTNGSKKRKKTSEAEETQDEESEYEKRRKLQIEQNMMFALQLGLVDAKDQLKPKVTPSKEKTTTPKKPKTPTEPLRKSSRLLRSQTGGSPSLLNEEEMFKELTTDQSLPSELNGTRVNRKYFSSKGAKYDPVNGTTCHQCRQKTIDEKSKCKNATCEPLGRHRFCRSCLKTRYHENLDEVLLNPEWVCPTCRGSCNCSHCRRKR